MVKVDDLKNQIAKFTTLEDCKEGHDKIAALRVFFARQGQERSMALQLNAGAVRLAWKMGKILKDIITKGRPSESVEGEKPPKLVELGIGKTMSHKYQTISDIPEKLLEERLEKKLRDNKDISEAEFYRFAIHLEKLPNEESKEEEEDGTSQMNSLENARKQFTIMARDQIADLRKREIPGVDLLTDDQLELIAVGIIESTMEGNGKVKKKIEKFLFENALDESNYWNGFSCIVKQIKSVKDSLSRNTTPNTPKALLIFNQNLHTIINYVLSWKKENLGDCPECDGKAEVPVPQGPGIDPGQMEPCDNCFAGKVGWYKG